MHKLHNLLICGTIPDNVTESGYELGVLAKLAKYKPFLLINHNAVQEETHKHLNFLA